MIKRTAIFAGLGFISGVSFSGNESKPDSDRPNFLFLVIEDASPYLFPAYGNTDIETPNLDILAEQGVVFTGAMANAPYSSPARSSLISGSYATTYGNDWHRNQHIVPSQYFFPQYLRDAGYYTVNAGKTDYNVTREVQRAYYDLAWDSMSGYHRENQPNVSYNDPERNGKPFFAQFNNNATHMSRINSVSIHLREPPRLDKNKVELPPYVPDLPETRSDYALHLDGIVDVDKWVGVFMDDLEERDLLRNTIIFFFSDHGGCLPRGKAFPYESGFAAALIVYAPPAWSHLLPAKPGLVSDRLVEFADFGPTLLSIAGVEPPEHMQGKAFMGDYAREERKYAYNFRTNTEDHFDPSRSVFTKDFQYIKHYTPYRIHGLRQSYQWAMPAQMAWDSLFHFAQTKPEHQHFFMSKPREMLFSRQDDPFGMNNLAGNPEYAPVLEELRSAASMHIRTSKDLGFFPRDIRDHFVREGISLYTWVRENDYPFNEMYKTVEVAADPAVEDIPFLTEKLAHERPEIRFWGASGLAYLAFNGMLKHIPPELEVLLGDDFGSLVAKAAETLVYAGETEPGLDALVAMAWEGNTFATSSLEQLGERVKPALPEIEKLAEKSPYGRIRFNCRSILINFGMLPIQELFIPSQVENFNRQQKNRVENWAPSLP